MDKIKKLLLFRIPMSICNFRCHYCYLAQRPVHYQGIQPVMKYTPEQVGHALRKERLGGLAFGNFCADGETLLTTDIDKYVRAFVEQGHYAEVVTNLTVTSMLDKFLAWPKPLLKHLEFKCSFHYLELKKRNLLDVFAANVKKVWEAGASATIELAPSDELIPYIDEVKTFSINHFGALPQMTILRNDTTEDIELLTKLSKEVYCKTWMPFDSGFWKFKMSIFGRKQTGFCYAGAWGLYIDLTTGDAQPCYSKPIFANVFENPDSPFPIKAVGRCPIAHCYNGHALMTLGYIPSLQAPGYGSIRDRIKNNGEHWLQPELLSFFNSKLEESNREYSPLRKSYLIVKDNPVLRLNYYRLINLPHKVFRFVNRDK